MSLGRVLYRVRQFFLALRAAVDPRDLEQARSVLTPAQMALFYRDAVQRAGPCRECVPPAGGTG